MEESKDRIDAKENVSEQIGEQTLSIFSDCTQPSKNKLSPNQSMVSDSTSACSGKEHRLEKNAKVSSQKNNHKQLINSIKVKNQSPCHE